MSGGYSKGTAAGLDTPRGEDWRARAACRDEDPELFFPIGNSLPALKQEAEAKAVCIRCPSRAACLDFAQQQEVGDGIYGGLTAGERRLARVGGDESRLCKNRLHEMTADNTVYLSGMRRCRACRMETDRLTAEAKREQRARQAVSR